VPRPYSSCCGITFHAAVMFFVPWQSSSCCGKALHAMAKLSCCGKKMTCHGIAWRHSLMLQLMSWQEMMCHSIAWHSTPSFLHALGKKRPAAAACHIVQHRYSLCCGQVHRAVVCLFVTQQEMTCHSIPCCCSLFHSKKQCAAAFCGIAHHGELCRGNVSLFSYCKDGEK